MSDLVHVAQDADSDEIISLIDRDGAVIVDNVLAPLVLAQLHTELDPILHASAHGTSDFGGTRTKRIGALLARSAACRELAVNPIVVENSRRFLSPYCDDHQLHFTQAVSNGPSQGEQRLHRDRGVWPHVPSSVETQFSTIWALTDFTRDNGCTRVVPGSHRWDDQRVVRDNELAFAEMKAGSVMLYTGSVLHGGGANTTDAYRTGVLIHYTLNWLRQEENQYLSCPPDVAAHFSPELRRLIGYSMGGAFLGFWSDPAGRANAEVASPEVLFTQKSG